MTEPKLSLHRKLAQIMYEAERIPKRGRAPQAMGGYEFVQVGDAADFIRKALAEKVLTMMPTKVDVVGMQDRPTKSGGSMTTLDLRVEWTITDGESGETIVIESFGAGADGGDKYSGKAMTNAMKYALLAGFLLSTGDDVEQHAVESVTPAQINARERAQLAKREVVDTYMGGEDLTGAQAKPVLDALEKKITNGDGSLIGTVEIAKDSPDFLPHVGPDGPVLTFKLTSPDGGIKVIATGALAEVLPTVKDEVVGQRVSCWGRVRDETFTPQGSKKKVTYQVLDLERIKTPTFTLPGPLEPVGLNQGVVHDEVSDPLDEPPDNVVLFGETV